jgi:hypothetical protein
VPKSKKQEMTQLVIDTLALCETNAEKCAEYEALDKCPSRYTPAAYDPKCNQWKAIKECESEPGSTTSTKDECATNLQWLMYVKHKEGGSTDSTDDTAASRSVHKQDVTVLSGILVLVHLAIPHYA